MRLVDLEPRWLMRNGQRIGFAFRSPVNPAFWQTCFASPTPSNREQRVLFEAEFGDQDHQVQGCNPAGNWAVTPAIASAEFASLSVTPSLDGSRGGLWHGFITNGEIVGGLG